MTARQPLATVDVGRWSCTVRGPVRVVVPAVRDVCGSAFTLSYDNRARELRVPLGKAHDLIAALEARGARVDVRGRVPDPMLFDGAEL
jgi:hypothetical protein